MADIPGIRFSGSPGVDRARLPGAHVRPSQGHGYLRWPKVDGSSSASPAHERAFGADSPASGEAFIHWVWEGLELPGIPSDYHFLLQHAVVTLWSRRGSEPGGLYHLEVFGSLDLALLEAAPYAVLINDADPDSLVHLRRPAVPNHHRRPSRLSPARPRRRRSSRHTRPSQPVQRTPTSRTTTRPAPGDRSAPIQTRPTRRQDRLSFSGGGQRRDGFERLRDIITRHRQGWTRAYLDTYLKHRWTDELTTVSRELHRHVAAKAKPPTFRQFAKIASVAANHWFNGDLAGLYTAIGEKAPKTPRCHDLLPGTADALVHTVYRALGGQYHNNDLRITNYSIANRFHQISRLASAGPQYVQIAEALGRPPRVRR